MNDDVAPGRTCPLAYRYGAAAIAHAPQREVATLYVIGGLYGNRPALDAVEALARAESPSPTLCFNGDFNWFNIAHDAFAEVNARVLACDAVLGNVEAELGAASDDAGCGCAYPPEVDRGVVERSNRIHHALKRTARQHPDILHRLARLPMFARYRVADCQVGVVHGDADALAGWGFDVTSLDAPRAAPWVASRFAAARVDLFASTHTCLPAMRRFPLEAGGSGWVINNGAAGMPNFAGQRAGLVTRIGRTPSPWPTLHEASVAGAYAALLPLRYDHVRWQAEFLAQWPPGSAAWESYFERITRGPDFPPARALAAEVDAARTVTGSER